MEPATRGRKGRPCMSISLFTVYSRERKFIRLVTFLISSTDPEQKALRIEAGWPNDKASESGFGHPCWPVCHEITVCEGLPFKQGHVAILTSVR